MRALISTSSRYSRGLNILLARHSSTVASISRSKAPAHIFYSQSSDPWLNLSIEHYIFQNAPARSRILLFYTNRPCVVIGRNQNPWLEVNLKLLETGILDFASNARILKGVDLVRRRSGGGTVFHDEGNVNWGVICDLGEFSRDKHAEMVVRGLRRLGVDRARVNERHDVVVDQGEKTQPVDGNDAHSTAYNALSPNLPSLKVSGSAYKIARNRALHHGTALVASDNLSVISQFLHSPAKSRITAKGVESVSSPIANIGISNRAFEEAVEKEFRRMYGLDPNHVTSSIVGEECLEIKDIENGYKELKSDEWTYLQTPQFDFKVSSADFGRFTMVAKHGTITDSKWSSENPDSVDQGGHGITTERLNGQQLHSIRDWASFLQGSVPAMAGDAEEAQRASLTSELDRLLPTPTSNR